VIVESASRLGCVVRETAMRKVLMIVAALLAASTASAQPGAPFCLATDLYGGTPDCSYWTWAACRASQPGVGRYCYTNTAAGYVFDTRDPNNPRVILPRPIRKPRTRY
jgi:hypothetical protein